MKAGDNNFYFSMTRVVRSRSMGTRQFRPHCQRGVSFELLPSLEPFPCMWNVCHLTLHNSYSHSRNVECFYRFACEVIIREQSSILILI